MAQITYWVDPVSGSDANAGTSFGAALQTNDGVATKIVSAGNGNDYTVNLVNTGDHPWSGFTTQIDNQTASTFHIRGTDSSGDPALAKVVCDVTITTVTQPFFYIREHANILVEYIETDTSLAGGTHSLIYSRDENDPAVQTEVRFCKFVSASLPSTNTSTFIPVYRGSSNYTDFLWHHCYYEGQTNYINSLLSVFGDTKIYNNVLIDTGEKTLFSALAAASFSATGVEIYNNTVFVKATSGTSATPVTNAIINHSAFSGTMLGWTIKNNLFWKDSSPSCTSVSTGQFLSGSTTGTAVYDGTEDIGYNMFYLGPNVEALGDSGNVVNYNGLPFDPGVDDLYPGDVRRDDVTEAAAFNDTSSTYDWTPDGSAVTITIAFDLRPLLDTTAGEGGTVPGALPPATTDYTVTCTTNRSVYKQGFFGTVTVTVTNTGTDATGVVVALDVPGDFTDLGASSATSGTYTNGVWTVGDLGNGETHTLTVAFGTGTAEGTQTFTAAFSSGNPDTGGDTSDDTDTAVVTVKAPPPSSGDPDEPAAQPFLDVVPVNADLWELDLNVAMQTKRNRLRRHYVRSDDEGEYVREISLRRLTVGTNTSTQVTLGGIEIGQNLLLESDTQVDVSVGITTGLWVAGKVFVLSGGDFEQVHIRNTSTTVDATVYYGVTD